MKRKQARCMADGGVIRETPEQMLARMNAKYGLGDAGKSPAPQPQPAPTQQPAASPQPSQPSGLMGKATDAIGRRNEELKKAANYARGGIMPVVGAGTGTSDSVPVVVAGQDVRLSNGEGAAILPARTMKNPAAVQAVEGIIEATNGKPPVRGARGLAYGGILGQQNQTNIPGVWRTGNSFTQTDSGPSLGTPAIAAAISPATQPVSAQPVQTQTPTTNIVRNGNSFSAATPSLSSQALTSPAGQPAPAPLVGQASPVQPTVPPSPTPATPTTDAYGNSLALTQRYQKQLDELQNGAGNQVMRLAAGGVIDPNRLPVDEFDRFRTGTESGKAAYRALMDAKNASMNEYKAELATRDVMASRAAEAQNMQSALAGAKSQPAINPKALPAQPIYRPNWTPGNNAPVLEGTVETAAELAAKANHPRPSISAPQPGTNVVARGIDWIPGGTPPAGGAIVPRTIDWTYGEGGGPQPPTRNARPSASGGIAQLLSPPPETVNPANEQWRSQQTAVGRRSAGQLSPEAEAYINRPAFQTVPAQEQPPGMASRAMGRANDALKAGFGGHLPGVPEYVPTSKFTGAVNSVAKAAPAAMRFAAPVAVAADAYDRGSKVMDVANNPNASKADVATSVAEHGSQMSGGLAGAGIGAGTALQLGAPLIAGSGPFAPVTAAGLALLGGGIGYYGGSKAAEGLTWAGRKAIDQFTGNDTANYAVPVSTTGRGAQQSAARKIDQASVQLPVQNGATTTSDAGNARFNPESGILSFTQPGFDPTKQQFAPGSGAISNAAGKTLLLAPSGIAGAAQPTGAVDAYGNSTARTDQMKAELAQLQANGGQGEGPRVSMLQSLPAEQADRDRFAQFVRQADADRLAHDLATGGGNARSNAGRIAALNAMRGGIADELGRRAQVEAAGIQGANQMAVERQRGLSQLANTRLAGQTQMAVEDIRQSGPEKALRATKMQGEVEDEKAARAARNNLLSAINSGDPGKISKAWRMGIAAGVVKPEQQERATPYKFHTDADGRSVRINEATGATDVLDRADGTYKPVRTSDSPYPDGTRLEGADKKTYVVRNGVPVLEGKK